MRHFIRQILLILGTLALLASLTSCGHGNSNESKAIAEGKNELKTWAGKALEGPRPDHDKIMAS